ncbi:MAG: hypothetical protein K6A67_07430 [Bacteroidales bacterium]|nr:hypothetical protein [Bacteroidales bacterium]
MEHNTKSLLLNVIDEAIEHAHNASRIICDINYRFAQHGLPMLVVSDSHKMVGNALGINREEMAVLDTFSMKEAVQLAKLAIKIKQSGNNPYPPISVILSGNTRKGMLWVKLMDELMTLKLKSLPFSALYSGKHYNGKGLFIIVSDLPVADLKRGFPKLYSDVILLEKTPSGV